MAATPGGTLRLPRQARPVSRVGDGGAAAAAQVVASDWDDGTASCSSFGIDPGLCQHLCSGGFGSVPEGLCQPTPDWFETNTGSVWA